jgi:hypothetical protein
MVLIVDQVSDSPQTVPLATSVPVELITLISGLDVEDVDLVNTQIKEATSVRTAGQDICVLAQSHLPTSPTQPIQKSMEERFVLKATIARRAHILQLLVLLVIITTKRVQVSSISVTLVPRIHLETPLELLNADLVQDSQSVKKDHLHASVSA